jgi:outer membrane protein OmpA-like peptidoglycan-associated protein
MKDNPQLRVEISGHSDNVGKPKKNLSLSKRRAAAVKTYLVKKKIKAKRIIAIGLGDKKPKYPNDTAENREKNRRIDFRVLPAVPEKVKKVKKVKVDKKAKQPKP